MLALDHRPRELHWYHAGPMLFGDLGTSRLYVLGLAFFFTRHASFFHIVFVNILLVLVGACYLVICRKYPDGGGVYSSARTASRALAVVGGLMLCADYTVTAAMSCLDAFRYLGINGDMLGIRLDLLCTLGAIGLIGGLNWFGPRGMGRAALVVAALTVLFTLIIAAFAIPHLHHMRVELPVRERYSGAAWSEAWVGFTEIVLALSGIEAIANMTGIMVAPVRQTSRRSILPVLCEVVVLNIVLAAAMNALPDAKLIDPEGNALGTDDMMNVLGTAYVGPFFSLIGSFVFGALLLSAVNTAITDLIAIQYMMGRDGEVPSFLCRLNRHGVPGYALAIAMLVPALLLLVFPDLTQLAGLYSVGVVAAITINLFCTGCTRQFQLQRWERWMLCSVGVLMACILMTLLWNKPAARVFSLAVLNLGLSARLLTLSGKSVVGPWLRLGLQVISGFFFVGTLLITFLVPVESWTAFFVSAAGTSLLVYLGQFVSAHIPLTVEQPALENLDGDYEPASTFLVAASRSSNFIDEVMADALGQRAGVLVLTVKELSIPMRGAHSQHPIAEDPIALAIFTKALASARILGVPLKVVYLAGGSVVDRIIQTAVTEKASRIYLQLTRRDRLKRFFQGDVAGPVAERMPAEMELVIRA